MVFLSVCCGTGHAQRPPQATPGPAYASVDSPDSALDALWNRLRADQVYAKRFRPGCLTVAVEEENPHFFDLVVREKHGGQCGGDPATSPAVDRFRLYRRSDVLLWFDVVGDRYLSYAGFRRTRAPD